MSRKNRRRVEASGKRKRLNRKGAGRVVPPRTRCGKIGYRNEDEARSWMTLFAARHTETRAKVEKRAYQCHVCHRWHLTAQDVRT